MKNTPTNVTVIDGDAEARVEAVPMVSVILPTYNRSALLKEAIESVRNQEFEDWELLVIDDGSTDDTPSLLASYSEEPRIRCFRQSNAGQAAARNVGLQHARGEWVAFIDSDDRWFPWKLGTQLDALGQNDDVDVIYADIERINLEGTPVSIIGDKPQKYSGKIWRPLLDFNFVSMGTAIVRTARLRVIGGFREELRRAEDYALWLKLSTFCNFLYLPKTVSQYRIAGARVSNDTLGCANVNRLLINEFIEQNPSFVTSAEARLIHARFHGRTARELAEDGAFLASVAESLRGIRMSPSSWVNWRTLLAVLVRPLRNRLAR